MAVLYAPTCGEGNKVLQHTQDCVAVHLMIELEVHGCNSDISVYDYFLRVS